MPISAWPDLCHPDSVGTKRCPVTGSYGWLSDAEHGRASPKYKLYLVLKWQKLELLENCRLSSSYSSKSHWFNDTGVCIWQHSDIADDQNCCFSNNLSNSNGNVLSRGKVPSNGVVWSVLASWGSSWSHPSPFAPLQYNIKSDASNWHLHTIPYICFYFAKVAN